MKRAQISTEYLLLVGFVTFVVLAILSIAFLYTSSVKDNIKINQASEFSNKIISSAESVFYSGKPSKATITVYLPEGVKAIEILYDQVVITTQTSSGENKQSFRSRVPIQGVIIPSEGVKKISLVAGEDYVAIM